MSIGRRKSTNYENCELREVHDDRWLQRIARFTFGGIDAIKVDCLQRGSGRPIHRIRFVRRSYKLSSGPLLRCFSRAFRNRLESDDGETRWKRSRRSRTFFVLGETRAGNSFHERRDTAKEHASGRKVVDVEYSAVGWYRVVARSFLRLCESRVACFVSSLHGGVWSTGDRCELKIAYEHPLPRFPASLTVGPFGGVRGRDFLCVQCLDGTLLFYEQEMFAFSQVTRNRLLAEPIIYVPRYDLFVAASSSWYLECHRHVLARCVVASSARPRPLIKLAVAVATRA